VGLCFFVRFIPIITPKRTTFADMIVESTQLIALKRWARREGLSTRWAHHLYRKGRIRGLKVDIFVFIFTSETYTKVLPNAGLHMKKPSEVTPITT